MNTRIGQTRQSKQFKYLNILNIEIRNSREWGLRGRGGGVCEGLRKRGNRRIEVEEVILTSTDQPANIEQTGLK